MPINTDLIVKALEALGGQAKPAQIAAKIKKMSTTEIPKNAQAVVRARIQEQSSDSIVYRGKRDIFYSVYGIGEGVWGLRRSDPLNPESPDGFSDDAANDGEEEGKEKLVVHLRKERSRKLVCDFKKSLKSFSCVVCNFNFERKYGGVGKDFIEAHHTKPVSQLVAGGKTKITDLVAVCSNCHRMLHRNGLMSWEELKARIDGD